MFQNQFNSKEKEKTPGYSINMKGLQSHEMRGCGCKHNVATMGVTILQLSAAAVVLSILQLLPPSTASGP